jgi:hypothetical protein
MKRLLLADMDAVVLSVAGLLVAAGIVLHVWGRLEIERWIS